MKYKHKKALKERKERIAAGVNNGWLNFSLEVSCRECEDQSDGAYCHYREDYLDFDEKRGCVRQTYEAKKAKQ